MDYGYENLIVNILTLGLAFFGGLFALYQWHKSLVLKRTEIVRSMINSVRENKTIATIMDIIDWNEGFYYDGKFKICSPIRNTLQNLSNDDLFKMIDETLSVFSYICYLESVHVLVNIDMHFFEYEIRRLADNKHIRNYLYSLYHWSQSLGVNMSFSHLVKYCLAKGYLDKSFLQYDAKHSYYTCFLHISSPHKIPV